MRKHGLKMRVGNGFGSVPQTYASNRTPCGKSINPTTMVTLILVIAGLLCFALFFGSIKFFEKI